MRFSQLLLAVPLLLACDTEPSGPDGPSGGENRFRVVIDDEKERFDEIDLEIRSIGDDSISLVLTGNVDPLKNAVDDEYALHLDIQLDEPLLLATSAPATLTVKGKAIFAPGGAAGGPESVEYEMDPAASPVVKGLFFKRSCFCANEGSGEQSFDGTITIEQVSSDEMTGTLTIHLDGDVPNYPAKLDALLSAEFNLAIP